MSIRRMLNWKRPVKLKAVFLLSTLHVFIKTYQYHRFKSRDMTNNVVHSDFIVINNYL